MRRDDSTDRVEGKEGEMGSKMIYYISLQSSKPSRQEADPISANSKTWRVPMERDGPSSLD